MPFSTGRRGTAAHRRLGAAVHLGRRDHPGGPRRGGAAGRRRGGERQERQAAERRRREERQVPQASGEKGPHRCSEAKENPPVPTITQSQARFTIQSGRNKPEEGTTSPSQHGQCPASSSGRLGRAYPAQRGWGPQARSVLTCSL